MHSFTKIERMRVIPPFEINSQIEFVYSFFKKEEISTSI